MTRILGKPKSNVAIQLMQDGPIGVSWRYGDATIEKTFDARIEVEVDPLSDLLVVIGHWGSSIGEFTTPDNGVVFNPDGAITRRILVPPANHQDRPPRVCLLIPRECCSSRKP
ncbi:MAG: hypothetical protein U1F35_02935 [Steroidobacteraceae bacterium]